MNLRVIVVAARDGFMKNRRVGCHAPQAVLGNAHFQLGALDHAAGEIIDLVGLVALAELA